MTHPFHPLRGQDFEFVEHKLNWGEDRVWLRGGPAALLAWDPGFTNARFEPGVTLGASYAIVKVGTFALDLRLDAAGGLSTAFGTVGVGANLN